MRTKRIVLASFLLVPLGAALAQTQEKQPTPAGAPKDDPAMAAMMKYGEIGPNHALLEPKIGKWNAVMKMAAEPGGPVTESTGTSEMKWILNGRFVQDSFTGDFAGQTFHGLGTTGYDNIKKKFVGTWMDDMSTGIFTNEGTYDPATKTFTYVGEGPDPTYTKYVKNRMVEKWIDHDHFVFQAYAPGPDGKETLGMEIHYTRVK